MMPVGSQIVTAPPDLASNEFAGICRIAGRVRRRRDMNALLDQIRCSLGAYLAYAGHVGLRRILLHVYRWRAQLDIALPVGLSVVRLIPALAGSDAKHAEQQNRAEQR